MAGKLRPSLRAKTLQNVAASNLSVTDKRCIEHVFAKFDTTPKADVVEVVKCEKCKYLTIHNRPTLYAYCEKTHYEFKPFETDTRTHFCSYGARKEGIKQ